MKLATWNVNSIRQRGTHVIDWLARARPDVLVLQEIKCETQAFPGLDISAAGYRSVAVGQKAYNGVAFLAREPFQVTHTALPGLAGDDAQARYIEAEIGGITVIGIYLPNGNSGGDAGYAYKLAWMDRLAERAEALLDADRDVAILGDFNVCPQDIDAAPGTLPPTDALMRPETRARYRRLLWAGLTDAIRAIHPSGPVYTFWDYQAGAWQRDRGLRIDHALLSPRLAERLLAAAPDRDERARPTPSDHVPVTIEISP